MYEEFAGTADPIPGLRGTSPISEEESRRSFACEQTIERNSLLEHLKSWAKEWPRGVAPLIHVSPCGEDFRGTTELNSEALTPCEKNILRTLMSTGRRMTRLSIQEFISKLPAPDGDSTIANALSDMIKQKILDNRQNERPKGYGLTDRGKNLATAVIARDQA
jgi:hypothetical protein